MCLAVETTCTHSCVILLLPLLDNVARLCHRLFSRFDIFLHLESPSELQACRETAAQWYHRYIASFQDSLVGLSSSLSELV
jgi:hypothetical protein